MLRNALILSLVCISMSYSMIEAANASQSSTLSPTCNDRCQSSRISARHIENKGIGYKTGYTTVEAFLAAPTDLWSVMPFVDLRGHIFNDGHWAANGGLGLRSLLSNRIYGAYAYYDYRDTNRKSYNQVSFGVETLGIFWDLRLNGYVVVGDRQSRKYDTKFNEFAGHRIYYTQKFQYALSGGNAEAGFYPLKMQNVTLYTGFGPYYLQGPVEGAVWGGQARVKAMWKDYVGAEVSYSYDHTFKNIVQGQVFLSLPFGPKRKVRKSAERTCIDNYLLCQRMIEPVGKSEIIPVKTKKSKKLAINPATGQPYTVWFVNNLSHSNGTFESPFSTLAAAQNASGPNDIIYVYPGDLTSTGLSNGITLQNGQQLLGATINQSLKTTAGTITLPAQASGTNPPLLSNGTGAVVTLASNNVVSGFYIQNTAGSGILASGSSNATLTQNLIQGNSNTYNGIELDNVTGTVTVTSNTIFYQTACVNINNTNPVSNASYLFTGNTLDVASATFGFNISYTEGSNNYFLCSNNNLYGSETAGINITCSNTIANSPHIFNITDCNIRTYANYAVELVLNNSSIAQLNIQDSTLDSNNGVYTITNNQSQLTSTITNNSFNCNNFAFNPETHNSSSMNATFANNSVYSGANSININCFDASALTVSISENTLSSTTSSIQTTLSGSAVLAGTINDNTLNSLNFGIFNNIAGSSTFAVNINNNVINAIFFLISTNVGDSSTYSGNIMGNTFVGLDSGVSTLWNIGTSGNVASIVSNNFFTGNQPISLNNLSTGMTTLQILNNTVQNSTSGIMISNSGTNFQGTVSGNAFQGFVTNAVNVSNLAGTMCLHFNNNTSNPFPNAYVISVSGGTLDLVTPTGNLGQLQTSGVTPVSQCP